MQATIIGGHGFIGSSLTLLLENLGWHCWLPSRSVRWSSINNKPLGHVFYCAGLTADYINRPFDTIEAHVTLLSRILRTQSYASLTYLSSTRLYDAKTGNKPCLESDFLLVSPENERHLYDLSKLTGEALCLSLSEGSARIARLSCVYNCAQGQNGFLGEIFRLVKGTQRGGVIPLDSSPHFCRDYIYIDDVLNSLIQIAMKGKESIYNVASGVNFRNSDIACIVKRVTGRNIVFKYDGVFEDVPQIDNTRIVKELGVKPLLPNLMLENILSQWV